MADSDLILFHCMLSITEAFIQLVNLASSVSLDLLPLVFTYLLPSFLRFASLLLNQDGRYEREETICLQRSVSSTLEAALSHG
jgi:hypothetical protein